MYANLLLLIKVLISYCLLAQSYCLLLTGAKSPALKSQLDIFLFGLTCGTKLDT